MTSAHAAEHPLLYRSGCGSVAADGQAQVMHAITSELVLNRTKEQTNDAPPRGILYFVELGGGASMSWPFAS